MRMICSVILGVLLLASAACSDLACGDNELKIGKTCFPVKHGTDAATATTAGQASGADVVEAGRPAVDGGSGIDSGHSGLDQVATGAANDGRAAPPAIDPGSQGSPDAAALPARCEAGPVNTCNGCDPLSHPISQACGDESIDVCVPGSKTCADGTIKTCDAQGRGFSTTACPSERPICAGNGSCAQCARASDCPLASECAIADCQSGNCVTSLKAAGSTCSRDICDAKGTCGPAPTCGDGIVNQPSEQCDDGNGSNIDDCVSTCKLAVCGDGFINSTGPNRNIENCEPGVGGETAWTCDMARCQRQTMYKACTSRSDCGADESCYLGNCSRSCSPSDGLGSETDCPAPPPPLSAWCQSGTVLCRLVNCSVNPECPRGQQCKILSADDRASFSNKVFKSMCMPPP